MRKIVLFLPFITLFAACAAINNSDSSLEELKKEVAKLQIKCADLETRQAESYSKYEENMVDLEIANAAVQELYKKYSKLSQEISDIDVLVKNQKSSASAAGQESSVQVPSEIYETAYNDFLHGKYELSIFGFKSFLKQYKTHDLAAQAQYYIAESLYSQENWPDAYTEYEKVEKFYSDNREFVPAARLKMALCLELLGQQQNSLAILQSILKDYPRSAEAFTAKEKIKQYTNNDKNSK